MELKTKKINKEECDNYSYIFIFGDSHCLCFGQGDTIVDNKFNIQMLKRDSASARGLGNENSTLKYGIDIKNFIYFKKGFGNNKPYNSDESKNYYLFKFGQVDSQINYYFKKIVKKEDIDKNIFFNEVIDEYITFLNSFKNYNIIVCGINMPSPTNYKRYLINCFNIKEKNLNIDDDIEKITLEEMNNDTIIFNELLKNQCQSNSIKYFDLTYECTIKIDNKIMLCPTYIGNDHHYNGCRGLSVILNNIKIYNDNNNIIFSDYINHPLYVNTYKIFIYKLITTLCDDNKNKLTINKIDNDISYLLNDINNLYFFHNNIIKYELQKYGTCIVICIENILSKNNKLDENIKIFGVNIRGFNFVPVNIKLELESNLPVKIFTGKKWIHYNKNIIEENIFIEDINKWRISISDNFLERNIERTNILFTIKFNKIMYIDSI